MSQNEMILQYMKDFGSITPHEAVREFACYRLSARIHDLRHKQGRRIKTTIKTYKNKYGVTVGYAEYSLIKEEENDDNQIEAVNA